MKQNSEYRAQARAALEGRWTEAVLMILIYLFLALFLIVPMCAVAEHFTIRIPWLAESASGWTFLDYGFMNRTTACFLCGKSDTFENVYRVSIVHLQEDRFI